MDIYKKKWTTLQSEIFSLMCVKSGDKMSQREIAKYLKVSPTAIANSLDLLEKENLIKVEKNRSMNLISLNPNERKVADLKRVENLKEENGWLNLAGLYWLKPGENTFGTSPGVLSLAHDDSGKSPTVFSVSNYALQISQKGI